MKEPADLETKIELTKAFMDKVFKHQIDMLEKGEHVDVSLDVFGIKITSNLH